MNRVFDETGAMGGLEGLAFGILIFVFGTFMILNAWAVVDGNMAASAAAREAARAYVEAPSDASGRTQADAAANEVMAGHNHLTPIVAISASAGSGTYQRCEPVTATVTVEVPRVSLPLIGAAGGFVKVHGVHTEVIDPYRSGLSGTANCVL